jgi:hypothetical protein
MAHLGYDNHYHYRCSSWFAQTFGLGVRANHRLFAGAVTFATSAEPLPDVGQTSRSVGPTARSYQKLKAKYITTLLFLVGGLEHEFY